MNNKIHNSLKRVAQILILDEWDYKQLTDAILEYKDLLNSLTNLDFDQPELRENIYKDHGKAIGLEWAARCVDDMMRTKFFVNGLYEAIIDAKKSFPGKRITILYAGTGPYATLALPTMALFSEDEIEFICLEINPLSYNSVRNLIDKLGFSNYVREFHNCDATEFKISNPETVDILLCECLQHALARESQVAITFIITDFRI